MVSKWTAVSELDNVNNPVSDNSSSVRPSFSWAKEYNSELDTYPDVTRSCF